MSLVIVSKSSRLQVLGYLVIPVKCCCVPYAGIWRNVDDLEWDLKKKDQHDKQETHCILWQIKGSEHGPNPESHSSAARAFFWGTGLNPFSQTKPQLSWSNIATTEQLNRKEHLLSFHKYFAEPALRTTEGRAQELGQAEKPQLYE